MLDEHVVMPEGYKAQVVATSRQAAITYREKLLNARDELSAKIAALSPETLALSDDELEQTDAETRFRVSAHPALSKLNALEIAVVISGDHNDPESWWDWSDKSNQEEYMKRFKRKLATEKTEKTDPLSILVVNNMLLTGFDAPVEQVMYLDRKIVAHDLLQAIARVNRTGGAKKCGYVVDYIGVARHLNEALHDYDGEDVEGSLPTATVAVCAKPACAKRESNEVCSWRGACRVHKQMFARTVSSFTVRDSIRLRSMGRSL